jgi:hypothetical protein
MSLNVCSALAAVLLSVSAPLMAQQLEDSKPAAPSPRTSGAGSNQTPSAAGLAYDSAFSDYRGFTDERVTSWKAANERVGNIGGWRTYAKEASAEHGSHGEGGAQGSVPAQAPASPASSKTRPAAAPAPATSNPAKPMHH